LCETVDIPIPDDDVGDEDAVGLVDDGGGPIDSPFCGEAEEVADGGVVVVVAVVAVGVVVAEAREGRTTFMRRPEPARRSRRKEEPSKTSTHSVSLRST
jgi:hypothetical protein